MTNLRALILRHGQTNANEGGIIQGSSDFSRLTELGCQQARQVWKAFQNADAGVSTTGSSPDSNIRSVYCSPLTRTKDTLCELLGETKRRVDMEDSSSTLNLNPSINYLPDLREIDFYDWQGKTKAELKASYPESWEAWEEGDPDKLVVLESGKETVSHYPLLETWDRADKVWDQIWKLQQQEAIPTLYGTDDEAILLVAHGSLGQALLGTAMGWGAQGFRKHNFPNCGIVELEWTGCSWNDLAENTKRPQATRWRWKWPETSEWNTTV
eukprot:Nitzschia sp. Nitz4//scaffold26_size159584//118461//119267//NITZ4_002508-RA/size159584-processed-gene-0.242-mRNA-1//-1//CDS//3329545133//3802//frame0